MQPSSEWEELNLHGNMSGMLHAVGRFSLNIYSLFFTVSKTSLGFKTYGLVQIKIILKTIKEEFSWNTLKKGLKG